MIAETLWSARRGGRTVEAVPVASLEAAYGIAEATVEHATAAKDVVVGYKIGLTDAGAQAAFGASEPAAGALLAGGAVAAGEPVRLEGLQDPRIELEVAIVLGEALTGGAMTPDRVRAATRALAPAFEIVASRWRGGPDGLPALVADQTNAVGHLVGPPVSPWELGGEATLTVDDEEWSVRIADRPDPWASVAWLAQHLIARGTPLQAGQVVLSGTLTPPAPLPSGALVRGAVAGLGAVELRTA